MIGQAVVYDIEATEEFIEDVENAPISIQKKVDDLIRQTLDGKRLPNSISPHQSFKEDLWIGYVNRSNLHWRLLFWYEEQKIILYRLLTHKEMNSIL